MKIVSRQKIPTLEMESGRKMGMSKSRNDSPEKNTVVSAKSLVIRDEIHGDMTFDPLVRQVIDHEYYQRLRYIKQLGLAEYVFPCATHTRFQHSLGAAYLASHYFESLVRSWTHSPFGVGDEEVEGTYFFPERTIQCVSEVANDPASFTFWKRVVVLAGLMHDVGHGPWSHTFEFLELEQDFGTEIERLTGSAAKYFKSKLAANKTLPHEDISVLYIHEIFNSLEKQGKIEGASRFFLPVAALVNRKLSAGKFSKEVEAELVESLKAHGIKGGAEMHRLLRPIISGPFDVDRIDYIQRDGRNTGVSIGGIEWRRILTKLVPCLAEHKSSRNEPSEVVLLSNLRNQHVLDDFIFSLFQMYAQVYMHPKIVGVEETVKRILAERTSVRKGVKIDFERHRTLSDEKFRYLLKYELGMPEVDDILLRKPGSTFEVASVAEDKTIEGNLKKAGYELINILDRPMMKDSMGVFLFGSVKELSLAVKGEYFVRPWGAVSPIARQFYSINYAPRIWIKER